MFYLWVAKHCKNPEFCDRVELTALNAERTEFHEFPKVPDELRQQIDPADRKFIAVANAHRDKPAIVEAADSKWIGWEDGLAKAGLRIEYINRSFLERLYERKMGGVG